MITLDLVPPRRVERHSYTGVLTAAAEAHAESGLYGAAVGAVETAARLFGSAFQVATVSPSLPALTPALLGTIGRRLITSGECAFLIELEDARIVLTECQSFHVVAGGPRPESWRYQVTMGGPHETPTTVVPGAPRLSTRDTPRIRDRSGAA